MEFKVTIKEKHRHFKGKGWSSQSETSFYTIEKAEEFRMRKSIEKFDGEREITINYTAPPRIRINQIL